MHTSRILIESQQVTSDAGNSAKLNQHIRPGNWEIHDQGIPNKNMQRSDLAGSALRRLLKARSTQRSHAQPYHRLTQINRSTTQETARPCSGSIPGHPRSKISTLRSHLRQRSCTLIYSIDFITTGPIYTTEKIGNPRPKTPLGPVRDQVKDIVGTNLCKAICKTAPAC